MYPTVSFGSAVAHNHGERDRDVVAADAVDSRFGPFAS